MPSGSNTNRVVFHTRRRYSAATTPVVCWNGREPTRRLTHDIGGARSTSALGALIRLRIEQAVQMHDEVAHMGVIDGLLGFRLPGNISGGVVGINADNVQLVELPEFDAVQIGELTTEDEMQQLSALDLIRHRLHSSIPIDRNHSLGEVDPGSPSKTPRPDSLQRFAAWHEPRRFDYANSASRSRMRPSNSA